MYWAPVADGVAISAEAQGPLLEDESFGMNFSWTSLDIDGSEVPGEWVFIEFDREDVEILGYEKIQGPFTFQGKTLEWYYAFPFTQIEFVQIQPPLHWHGMLTGKLFMNGTETIDPYPVKMSEGGFQFEIIAVADAPFLQVPTETIVIRENEQKLIPNLLAELVDTVGENGIEDIAIAFEGLPETASFVDADGNLVGEPSLNGKFSVLEKCSIVWN